MNIGDKIRIKNHDAIKDLAGNIYADGYKLPSGVYFNFAMIPLCGKVATITDISSLCGTKIYKLKIDGSQINWTITEEMIEPVSNISVIYNPPAVILMKNGKKYISKTNPYDPEQGLKDCLLQSFGVDLTALHDKCLKTVKRRANTGEYVLITHALDKTYKNGDILKIVDTCLLGAKYGTNVGAVLLDSEYVVLEGYNGQKRIDFKL